MQIEGIYRDLTEKIDKTRLLVDASMKEYTSFRAGGKAALLVIPKTMEEFKYAVKTLARFGVEFLVMGNGTNLLVTDEGYEGVILRIGSDLAQIEVMDTQVKAQAGALLTAVANSALENDLIGFEFASGIPGSLGGAAFMNAGAYGGEMSQLVQSVQVLSKDGREEYSLTVEEMNYGYRKSLLMERGDFVTGVTLNLSRGNHETIAQTMKDLTDRRTKKQPLKYPSAGSFFKRPVGHYAGQLIEEANLKGLRVGGARVSPLHAGFIINEKDATAADILDLMKLVQNIVYDRTGVMLEPEVRIIGRQGKEHD